MATPAVPSGVGFAIMQHIGYAVGIAEAVSTIAGIVLILTGVLKLKRYGQMRSQMSTQMTLAGPLMYLICGSILLALPTMLPAIEAMVFASANDTLYQGKLNIKGIIYFIRFLGLCAFIRGFIMLSRSGSGGQPGSIGKALVFVFAGVMLMHIVTVSQLTEDFFGLHIQI